MGTEHDQWSRRRVYDPSMSKRTRKPSVEPLSKGDVDFPHTKLGSRSLQELINHDHDEGEDDAELNSSREAESKNSLVHSFAEEGTDIQFEDEGTKIQSGEKRQIHLQLVKKHRRKSGDGKLRGILRAYLRGLTRFVKN